VDADGTPKLRNSGTTVYVDGRPTMMSLNQIPSDQIESVEVISNPSAKFEASTRGGILNIVLKKNRKPGYNGFVGLGIGTGKRYNGTGNLNVKQGRWNFTGFGSISASKNPTIGYTRRDLYSGQRLFEQNTNTTFDNAFKIARLGLDYTVNNRNVISFAGNIVQGKFNIDGDQNYFYPLATADTVVKLGSRTIRPKNNFTNYQLQSTWKKTYPQKGKELTADVTYGWGRSSNIATWVTTGLNAKGEKLINFPELTDISGGNVGQQVTAQLDYVNPINDSTKVEMGFRSNSNIRDQQTYFKQYDYKTDKYIQQNGISQNADITDMVNAAYITYSSRFNKGINYQAGLRYEQSKLDGKSKLENSPSFGYDFTKNLGNSLFPSVYLSKKIDKNNEIQLNYSRKIQRPNFMQLMPVIQNNDRQNIRIGNPKLQPEFVNMTEFNYNKLFGAHNWLVSTYFMLETNTIKPFVSASTDDPSVLISTFTNAKDETRFGIDNTLKLTLSKNVDFTSNFNIYSITITSPILPTVKGIGYDTKANLNYKFPKGFSAQVNGSYESDRVIPQGKRIGVAFADFAVKKSFFGGIANVTFSVNDVFNSRKEIARYDFSGFTQETMRRRDLRYYKLSLQMPFGKMDASIFKRGKNTRGQQGGQQDMDFGS
jgi:ferric enterobactin receptor